MIDHLLGRPSVKSRRLQVLAVLAFWSAYLFKGHRHGPPIFRFFSRLLSKRLTAWQTIITTMIYLYAARNFSTLVGLASPEPMANMYDATYFRATWVLTALDAGFWTAMKIKYKPLRDLASIVFSIFYMVAAEKADEKVRKVRGNITVEHLRVSWNKGNASPYLRFLQGLVRPRFTRWPPRAVRIPRPSTSDYKEPVSAWLYYDGPLAELEGHTKVVLDIPGGGFVAMDPRCNDDKLNAWAAKTGLPILSLDYKKAPEYPYPYALNECFDVYTTLIKSKGRCIGLSGRKVPQVVVTGDSAGGTLATSMTLMVVESLGRSQLGLPVPDGLVVFYPALDMNIGSWMSDEQMQLIKDRRMRGTNKRIIQRKTMQYNDLVGTPGPSDDEDESTNASFPGSAVKTSAEDGGDKMVNSSPAPEYAHSGPSTWSESQSTAAASTTTSKPSPSTATKPPKAAAGTNGPSTSHHPEPMRTRLAMSSMISYFNDRVLTPEMMRAMIILYVGPHNRPDFSRDYLLSPILAPDTLLAKFPKTYFLTGERDPLVDDTVIFAGRLRRVKAAQMASNGKRFEYRDTDANTPGFDEREVAEVALIPGISHGFLQFPAIYPPAWGLIERVTVWFEDLFVIGEEKERQRKRRELAAWKNGLVGTGASTTTTRGRSGTAGSATGIRGASLEGVFAAGPETNRGSRAGSLIGQGGQVDGPHERGRPVEVRVNGLEAMAGEQQQQQQHHGANGVGGKARRQESTSGDEDRPLEMMRMTRKLAVKPKDHVANNTSDKQQQQTNGGGGGLEGMAAAQQQDAENGDVEDEVEDHKAQDGDEEEQQQEEEEEEEEENGYLNPLLKNGNGNGNGLGSGGSSASGSTGSSTEREKRTTRTGTAAVTDKRGGGGGGKQRKGGRRGAKTKNKDGKSLSLVRLASSDDILGRRMHGLAGGLTGLPADAE
ncbi:hormone-sensitive lipase [Rhypophila decipiens]|uniref:Hormone-sensitive lipase n=1 Tax=Rhypophila decipiens TaxID=261697 RepID=A0AAN6YBJ7_9PEZI|nr:hormone-sensitive lipase [Rhypophila decipiens]